MRYDGYREIEESELPAEAHRRLIAVIDWVDHLFDLMDIQGLDDKVESLFNIQITISLAGPGEECLRPVDGLQFLGHNGQELQTGGCHLPLPLRLRSQALYPLERTLVSGSLFP